MKIVRITSENIKKLVAVEITPAGNVVRITGRNGQGKTSILDSIYWLFAGAEHIQDVPIRRGETKAKIEAQLSGTVKMGDLDIGDVIVRRTFTEKGTTLTLESKNGIRFPSPQAMLDKLIGRMSFDPLEFMRSDQAKQFQVLKQLTGVDTLDLDTKRNELYQERTVANRTVASLTARHNAIVVAPDAPDDEIASADVVAKLNDANAIQSRVASLNRDIAGLQSDIINADTEAADYRQDIDRERKAIEEAQKKIKKYESLIANLVEGRGELTEKIAAKKKAISEIEVPDIASIQSEIDALDGRNKQARAKRERKALRAELDAAEKHATNLSEAINAIDGEKEARISSAKFPLDGLGFGEGAVMFNGLPLEQASSAEQLRVSMAMAMALNPQLRVIRITDGSLLDSSSMKVVEEMAKDGDFQVWVESVDETGKVGIVIEDGRVVANNETATETTT